jgi:hypothetical protein
MLLTLIAGNSVHGNPGTKMIYSDQSFYTFQAGTPVGTTFNVTIWDNSTNYPWKLQMWQVYLSYNESMVNVTQIWGDVTNDWTYRAWPNDNFDGRTWDNDYVFKGKSGGAIGNPAYISSSLTGGNAAVMLGDLISSDFNISAPTKLCTIEFKIVAVPPAGSNYTCNLAINSADTYVFNSTGQITDATMQDASYTYVPEFSTLLLMIAPMVAAAIAAIFAKKLPSIRKIKEN